MSDTTTTQPGTPAAAPKRPRKKYPVLRVVVGLAALGLPDALVDDLKVDPGGRQCRTHAIQHNDAQREEDLPSQVDCSQR